MFEIEYKGGNTVVLLSKKASLVIDPKLSVVGLKDIKTKAAIVAMASSPTLNSFIKKITFFKVSKIPEPILCQIF